MVYFLVIFTICDLSYMPSLQAISFVLVRKQHVLSAAYERAFVYCLVFPGFFETIERPIL